MYRFPCCVRHERKRSKRRNIRDLFLAGSHALLAVFYAVRQISRFSIVTVKAKGE